ncbi:MAG: magnesium transporter [Bacteroidia bacterium]|jgi:magnesium transporter
MTDKTNNSRQAKAGLPPGALIHVGQRKTDEAKVSVIDYTSDEFNTIEISELSELERFKTSQSVTWINIDGLHDTALIAKVGKIFDLHPLLLEDVLNTKHRPKVEEFEDYIFLTLKMLGIDDNDKIVNEQVSFVLGSSWIISFQEQQGDVFDSLRSRLEKKKGNARAKGPDYLLYRLIDTVVDGYFFVTDHVDDTIESMEDIITRNPSNHSSSKLQSLKKELLRLRRAISPLREAITTLQNSSTPHIQPETSRYFGDVYEHIVQVNENIDNGKDLLADLREMYQSGQNNRLNEVMKVLTIMSTIFIPMTYIAGIYGMNFQYMPELAWHYGYFGALGLMILIPVVMLFYFKRKRWL